MVVPRLREVSIGVLGDGFIEWKREREEDAVLVGVECRRKLGGAAGVTHALHAAVGRGVRAPAGHSGDVELAVLRVEAAAVYAGEELAGQLNGRTLGLAIHRLAQDQEMRARAEAEMQKLTGERAEPASGDGHLTAARIVKSAREVNQRQIRCAAVHGTVVAVVATGPHFADHGCRGPLAFRVGDGDGAVRSKPEAVGVAKAGRDGFKRATRSAAIRNSPNLLEAV